MNVKNTIALLLRVIIGGVLIYSGASKAIAPSAEFAAVLAVYKILPLPLLSGIAIVWPWLELLVGSYVLCGYFTRIFASVAGGLFLVFLTVLVSAMLRKIDPVSCGCFGAGVSLSMPQAILADSGLLAASVVLFRLSTSSLPWSADSWINS